MGAPVVLQARVTLHGATHPAVEGVLITPALEALPLRLMDDGREPDGEAGDGLWTGRFAPAEPGQYELNVTARGRSGGKAVAGRRSVAFRVRRAARIKLAGGRTDLDFGELYPGETAALTLTPVLESPQAGGIAASLGPLAGPQDASIGARAFKFSSAVLEQRDTASPLTVTLCVPFDQPDGVYEGALELVSSHDRRVAPVRVKIARPALKVWPAEIDVGRILRGRSISAPVTVKLEGRGRQPVRVTLQPWQAPREPGPGFYVEGLVREFTVGADHSETISVTVRTPDGSSTGMYRSVLLVETPLEQVRVPVSARVVRPPMSRRTITLIALSAVAALLLALFLWDAYRLLRGIPPSPMRRCLVTSATLHALALFASALLYPQGTQQVQEQRIAVRAVRLAGDGLLAGGQLDGEQSALRELMQIEEQAPELDIAAAEVNDPAQKEAPEAEAPDAEEDETEIARAEHDAVADVSPETPHLQDDARPETEQPEVVQQAGDEKLAEDNAREDAEQVDLAATDAAGPGKKDTAEAQEVGESVTETQLAATERKEKAEALESEIAVADAAAEHEQPEVAPEAVQAKRAAEQAGEREGEVEVAAAEAVDAGGKEAVGAAQVGEAASEAELTAGKLDVAADGIQADINVAETAAAEHAQPAVEESAPAARNVAEPGSAAEAQATEVAMVSAAQQGSRQVAEGGTVGEAAARTAGIEKVEMGQRAGGRSVPIASEPQSAAAPHEAPEVAVEGAVGKIAAEAAGSSAPQVTVGPARAAAPGGKDSARAESVGELATGNAPTAPVSMQSHATLLRVVENSVAPSVAAPAAEPLATASPTVTEKRAGAPAHASERAGDVSVAYTTFVAAAQKGTAGPVGAAGEVPERRDALPRAGATARAEARRLPTDVAGDYVATSGEADLPAPQEVAARQKSRGRGAIVENERAVSVARADHGQAGGKEVVQPADAVKGVKARAIEIARASHAEQARVKGAPADARPDEPIVRAEVHAPAPAIGQAREKRAAGGPAVEDVEKAVAVAHAVGASRAGKSLTRPAGEVESIEARTLDLPRAGPEARARAERAAPVAEQALRAPRESEPPPVAAPEMVQKRAIVERQTPEEDEVSMHGPATVPDGDRTIGSVSATLVPTADMAAASADGNPRAARHDAEAPVPAASADFGGQRIVGLGRQVSSGRIVIGTAKYSGDWDCDKTAMPNLAYHIEKRVGFVLEAETKPMDLGSNDLFRCAFVFMTGHRQFHLSGAQVRQVRAYLAAGGALWINDSTHEGNRTFDDSVLRTLAQFVPDGKLEPIPMESPVFSACYDLRKGFKGYRVPPGDKYRENALRGIRIGDRWAVIYTRNDYGDGLEIDPSTFPLMKSLTNLSPLEMQEGSVRMGMNLAFYFLHSARGADEAEKIKIADMRRAVVLLPQQEERDRDLLARAQSQALFSAVEIAGPWTVQEDWSADKTTLAQEEGSPQETLSVTMEHRADTKNVVARYVTGDLSGWRYLVLDLDSRMSAGARVSIGLSTGKEWDYFESVPHYVRPGENPTVVFDLQAATFKSRASDWQYAGVPQSMTEVQAVNVLFHPLADGTIVIRNMQLAK